MINRLFSVLFGLCALVALAACGGSDVVDTSTAVVSSPAGAEPDDQPAEPEPEESGPIDMDPTNQLIENAESWDQTSTRDGGLVTVGIDCDNAMGEVMTITATGMTTPGIFMASLEPAVGSGLTLSVQPDGQGYGGSASTYDARDYIVQFEDLGGAPAAFTLTGC
jgi:hypothetical protein